MRVCFFNRSYWPDQAATGQLLTELAEDLVSRYGTQVTVVAGRSLNASRAETGSRSRLVTREAHAGVDIRRANGTKLPPRRFAARASNYVSYFAAATAASFAVDRPDVVVSLTDPPIVGLAALWTARRTGARFVFLCEDIFPEVATLLDDFHNRAVNSTLDRINRYLLRSADAIVALGGRMQRRLIEEKGADPERVHIIHNWADCDAIVPGPKDNAFAREQGLADRFVADAFGQRRVVAESRRPGGGRRSTPIKGATHNRDRRRRSQAPYARGDHDVARPHQRPLPAVSAQSPPA